ncbi:MSEP-CTERM sorting domain-containing protein [Alkaliphilus peptidifermentans]|uniref:MSEP-CTERM protein n=1 Tax=Alkaliphilus peptidifermentans DSM 18978 TaxID=1120976 RepID=A0A1G5FUC4_9FIRM|nr:MSEP-CTERM sorting domain-containing protein [Alkaliphilus peptidifermentans]SCY42925.1 MSEP-CTERM protein [Alkaliphilus peptidifermentans DSM 18978]
MKKLYRPYLIFFVITIPHIVLLLTFSRIFNIISTELTTQAMNTWILMAAYLIIAGASFTMYGLINWYRKKDIHHYSAVIMLATYLVFLFGYFFNDLDLVPSSVPNWMLFGVSPYLTILTLITPCIGYGMLILVHWTSEKYKVNNLSKEIALLIGIPVGWYIFFNIIIRIMWTTSFFQGIETLFYIIFTVSIVIFFFMLIRILYFILLNKFQAWQSYLSIVVIVGGVLGLMLNQGTYNMFGDFSHYSFYVLAVVTGVLTGLPAEKYSKAGIGIFIAKSITIVYSCYFFIVFLPYLPVSIIGIIFFGLGVLMLVPILLMFLHVRSLWNDYNYLRNKYKDGMLITLFLVGMMVIPSIFGLAISQDKQHLDNALSYVYQRSYDETTEINLNLNGIRRAIDNIKYQNENDFSLFSQRRSIPYLSAIYNSYVLDNLSISNEKLNRLEAIFYGEYEENTLQENGFRAWPGNVLLQKAEGETFYDVEEGAYKSWVHLELQNLSNDQSEYITLFQLPEGSYISDYYLYVFDEKKYGLIADKRAANWVYQQVRAVRQDPGLLTYVGDNLIEFKVFPFEGNERRKTGIEITHRHPIQLDINGYLVELDDINYSREDMPFDMDLHQSFAYITKEAKAKMTQITRIPEYYFLIDYSRGNENMMEEYFSRVNNYITEADISDSVKEIIGVNYKEIKTPYGAGWEDNLKSLRVNGGLHLDYSVKRIFYENYINNSDSYPIIIVVTDQMTRAILPKDFENFMFTAPEGAYYYQLDGNVNLNRYSLLSTDMDYAEGINRIHEAPVLTWGNNKGSFYIADDSQDSIIILKHDEIISGDIANNSDWENGVLLKAMYMQSILKPEMNAENTLAIVKSSLISEVMSPLTSFIVLETEAQEKAMLEKQKQLLATDKPIDIGDVTEMDEPSIIIIAFLMLVTMLLYKRYKTKEIDY